MKYRYATNPRQLPNFGSWHHTGETMKRTVFIILNVGRFNGRYLGNGPDVWTEKPEEFAIFHGRREAQGWIDSQTDRCTVTQCEQEVTPDQTRSVIAEFSVAKRDYEPTAEQLERLDKLLSGRRDPPRTLEALIERAGKLGAIGVEIIDQSRGAGGQRAYLAFVEAKGKRLSGWNVAATIDDAIRETWAALDRENLENSAPEKIAARE